MSTNEPTAVKVADLKADTKIGLDKLWYTTRSDVKVQPDGTYVVTVQFHPDGGIGPREWDADMGEHLLPVYVEPQP